MLKRKNLSIRLFKKIEALVDGSIMSVGILSRSGMLQAMFIRPLNDLINLFHRRQVRTNESKIKVQLYPNFFANLDVGIEEFEKKDCIKSRYYSY